MSLENDPFFIGNEDLVIAQQVLNGTHEIQVNFKEMLSKRNEVLKKTSALSVQMVKITINHFTPDASDKFDEILKSKKALIHELTAIDTIIRSLKTSAIMMGYPRMFNRFL